MQLSLVASFFVDVSSCDFVKVFQNDKLHKSAQQTLVKERLFKLPSQHTVIFFSEVHKHTIFSTSESVISGVRLQLKWLSGFFVTIWSKSKFLML